MLYRVAVRYDSSIDTIPELLTGQQPVLVGDSVVLGFVYREDEVVAGFRYRARTRSVETLPLPPNFNPYYSNPALSPDGRYVAFVANTGEGWSRAVVRTWPAGEPVLRGPRIDVPASDADPNVVRWTAADTAELYIGIGEDWLLVRGVVGRGVVATDTVSAVPG